MGKETEGRDSYGVKTGDVANETAELRNPKRLFEAKHKDDSGRKQAMLESPASETGKQSTTQQSDVEDADQTNSRKTLDDARDALPPETTSLFPSGDSYRASQPGAWGVHPTRRIDDDNDSTGRASSLAGDEEAGAANDIASAENTGEAEEVLIKAELVDDEEKMTVDAQMWDEEMAIKSSRKRSIQWTVAIVLGILIITVVIALSVTLTGRSDGGSANGSIQTQTVLASSSPTLSLAPSPSPSLIPSSHPSEMPSQAPTELIWQEQQVLDGVYLAPNPGTVLLGGERFGSTVHTSNIAGTPLANRTGKEVIIVWYFHQVSLFVVYR